VVQVQVGEEQVADGQAVGERHLAHAAVAAVREQAADCLPAVDGHTSRCVDPAGVAEHLQGQGYAVLAVNLRGQGANVRKAPTPQDWRLMIDDLQAAYQFLVDRHNRGKLNLSKFGVLALGEGANLAAA